MEDLRIESMIWNKKYLILPLRLFFSMAKTLIIRTFVWIHMTEVPTSMYFLFTLFIWNLLRCTVPTVCQPSPIIELFFRGFFLPKPGVDTLIRLLGPTEEGGRLAIGPDAGGSGVPFVICKLLICSFEYFIVNEVYNIRFLKITFSKLGLV